MAQKYRNPKCKFYLLAGWLWKSGHGRVIPERLSRQMPDFPTLPKRARMGHPLARSAIDEACGCDACPVRAAGVGFLPTRSQERKFRIGLCSRVLMPPAKIAIAPRRSLALFAFLAVLMMIGSYILVVLLAAACVYLPYLVLTNVESPPAQLAILFLGGIVIAVVMLWSLLPRRDKFEAPGLMLERSAHPRLFTELDEIAGSLDEGIPREVYLMGQVNAFVADRGGIMGFGSRRVMAIGLPLLSILTISEFRAILAHEFAHYYSGDTKLGPWVYKTQSAMVRTFENISRLGGSSRGASFRLLYLVVASVLKWYFALFLRVINFISRRKEYRADELACLVAGTQPLMQGLRKIQGASLAWPPYWNSEIVPVLNQGCIPAIADGFARFLAAPQISVQVSAGIEREIEEGKADPYDTHPALRDRLAAIQHLSVGSPQQNAELAISLVNDTEAAELQFIELLNPSLPKGSLRRAGWDEIGCTVTIPAWKSAVGEYASLMQGIAAESLPDVVNRLSEMGSKIRDPKGMLLTREQRTQRAGHLLAMALGLALLEKGWQLEAQPGSFYLHRGAERMNVFAVMEDLIAGELSREAWTARCNELGIAQLILSSPAGTAH